MGDREHVLAGLRQPQVAAVTAPELGAELRLELLDRVTERGLCEAQEFGGRGERSVPFDFSDHDQMNPLEHAREQYSSKAENKAVGGARGRCQGSRKPIFDPSTSRLDSSDPELFAAIQAENLR